MTDSFPPAATLHWTVVPVRLESHFARLIAWQNADGGWGYFPAKRSWLEPTVYSLLALRAGGGNGPEFARGWELVRSWQLPDGAWRASAEVAEPHWATSLAVTLHCAAGVYDSNFKRGVDWLLKTTGSEGGQLSRLVHMLRPHTVEFDPGLTGWGWQPGTSSWTEPTVHAILALKRAALGLDNSEIGHRIALGERMLLDRRSKDGGWNYGNRRVLGVDIPSFPETTAQALLALDWNRSLDWNTALASAERQLADTPSPLARSWLSACLMRFRGRIPPPRAAADGPEPAEDILLTAIDGMTECGVVA